MDAHDPGDECHTLVDAAQQDLPVPDGALWFGCWLQAGHYLHGVGGRSSGHHELDRLTSLDGGYAPRMDCFGKISCGAGNPDDRNTSQRYSYRSEELPQGCFLYHRIRSSSGRVYSMISWWDRTQGDERGACNSTFIVPGTHDAEQLLVWLPVAFPLQVQRLTAAGVRLVQVFEGQTFHATK